MRVAGHPAVLAVAGLAPWLPPGEPVEQLAGRWILLAHGNADRITRPADTWPFAERAASVTDVTAVEIRNGEHAMLRRARLWHGIAAEFARLALKLPAVPGELGATLRQPNPSQRPHGPLIPELLHQIRLIPPNSSIRYRYLPHPRQPAARIITAVIPEHLVRICPQPPLRRWGINY